MRLVVAHRNMRRTGLSGEYGASGAVNAIDLNGLRADRANAAVSTLPLERFIVRRKRCRMGGLLPLPCGERVGVRGTDRRSGAASAYGCCAQTRFFLLRSGTRICGRRRPVFASNAERAIGYRKASTLCRQDERAGRLHRPRPQGNICRTQCGLAQHCQGELADLFRRCGLNAEARMAGRCLVRPLPRSQRQRPAATCCR